MEKLKNSIVKSNESAAGPDGVYYQFLRHLPESCLHTLLKLLITFGPPGTSPHLGGRPRWFQFQNPGRILLILPTIGLLRSRAACHLERTVQLCINNIQKWVSENGFRFSVSKTTCVHFHRQRIYTEPELHLDGQPIPVKGAAVAAGASGGGAGAGCSNGGGAGAFAAGAAGGGAAAGSAGGG
ncbi:RNA-directed DNA polymerase from mobile element jockey [Plakobranchus ocellatus]|uniref:RNA-directed DNA polymerase from mobile element jockey n=1 Tax=Plakobranchus ocellatus TaxID=259542 RepID=A0AAV4AQ52_9GAST|nr:RNA-directed DNA polymerase from mobile element jockey [Plakobranchus ocellatus]